MLKGQKEMKMIAYTSESVKKAGVRLIELEDMQSLRFSSRKLTIALARTILAMNPKNEQLVYQAISSFSALYPIISDGEEFSFTENAQQQLRDYLLSTRTGELAPATGYLFAQQQLRMPFVLDFSGILKEPALLYPDLVAIDTTGRLIFIESKGSRDVRNKGKLREALLQSEQAAALTDVIAERFYALFISVTKEGHEAVSAIHYTYTSNAEQLVSQHQLRQLIYAHYATWFMLLGYEEEARRLAAGKPIKLKKHKKFIIVKKEKYYILNSRHSLFLQIINRLDCQFKYKRFAIAKEVLGYLQGAEVLKLPKSKHVNSVKKSYELFADGTLII